MALNTKLLSDSVRQLAERIGRGAWAEIGRKTGLSAFAVSKIAREEVTPSIDSWEKLCRAFPDSIPPPEINRGPWEDRNVLVDVDYDEDHGALPTFASRKEILEDIQDQLNSHDIQLKSIPVFDAGAGEPSTFSDGGYPVGEASEYILVDGSRTDDNTFAVQIHGDSMEPYLHEGDKVVVVPSAELQNGKLCFATWPGETSDRLVKRFRRVGDNIILESDNKEHEPIVLDANNGHGVRIYRVTQSVRDE